MEHYFGTLDFDRTIANTFEASPNGIGVIEAYNNSIKSVFGDKGLETYNELGGLRNQSPDQVVESILKENDGSLNSSVEQFLDEHILRLLSLIPSEKVREKVENRQLDNKIITELLIAEKLSNFFYEIGNKLPDGQIWPRLCTGFSSFSKTIERINLDKNNNIDITMAIVSSGHEAFIKKTFEIHNLKTPEIIITTDTMREIENPFLEDRSKPNPFTFNLAYKKWLKKKGISKEELSLEKIVHFGDDSKKDGDLAKNCGILFGHFDPESNKGQSNDNRFSFSDWGEVAQTLEINIELLSRGESFSSIFLQK